MMVYQQPPQPSRKRTRVETMASYDYDGLQQLQAHSSEPLPLELTPHGRHAQLQTIPSNFHYEVPRPSTERQHSGQSMSSMPLQTHHHHHRLPNQPPPTKIQRRVPEASSPVPDHGAPSVVGQPGMPEAAPQPAGPKLKFTPEDDALLIELKETKDLTWKQIADFFPGRSSGTLQVRYCTKLKAKTTQWTDEMVR